MTFLVKPVCAELKRSDSVVPFAATMVAPGTFSVNGVWYCDSSYTDTRALVMLWLWIDSETKEKSDRHVFC